MRKFTKVMPSMWTSPLFKSLGDKDRLLWLYYLAGHHQTITGVSRVPDDYAASDLGWRLEDCREARECLIEAGAIMYDDVTSEVLVANWWRDNGPDNSSHLTGAKRGLDSIVSEKLSEIADRTLDEELQRRQNAKRKPPPVPEQVGSNVDMLRSSMTKRMGQSA
jgi:hypothetical protein